jgi:hypothetical protein
LAHAGAWLIVARHAVMACLHPAPCTLHPAPCTLAGVMLPGVNTLSA